MRTLFIFIIILILSSNANCELIKPNVSIEPNKVIEIQLAALQKNNNPYQNAGIEQTWEFAHPSNRIFTGPLKKFTSMMYSPSYIIMLNHQNHKIFEVKINNEVAFYFIELTDIKGDQYGFQWTLEKVSIEGIYENCWMTTSVSPPISLAKST